MFDNPEVGIQSDVKLHDARSRVTSLSLRRMFATEEIEGFKE